MLIRALSEFLHKHLFKGADWQLLRYFQDGDFGERVPKYIGMLDAEAAGLKPQNLNRYDKKRLTDKLSRLVLLIDPERMAYPYQKQVVKAYQYMLTALFLRYLNAQDTARTYAIKALKLADKYQLHQIGFNMSEMLMVLSSLAGRYKDFQYYNAHYREAFYQLQLESRVKTAYHSLEAYFVTYSHYTPEIDQELKDAMQEAKQAYQERQTYVLLLYLSRIRSFYHELNHEFDAVIDCWQRYDNYVKARPEFTHPDHQGESHIKQMGACLNQRKYVKAQQLAGEAFKGIEKENWNWFYFNHLYLLLLTQTGNYQKAGQVLAQVFDNQKFNNLPVTLKELFLLMDGFMAFVQEAGWAQGEVNQRYTGNSKFKVKKLINDIQQKSSDKYGVNAILILLEVLFHFERGNWDALLEKQEQLKLYKNRYLRHKTHKRMYYFFDMLLAVIKAGFDPEKVVSKAAESYKRLQNTQYQFEGGYEDFEVIPFEQLWAWIRQQLNPKSEAQNPTS